WDRRNAHFFQMVMSLARHYDFDVETPWQDLPPTVHKAVLYGSGKQKIAFRYLTERGGKVTREHRLEGIVPNMQRRYRESESTAVREELSRYIAEKPCPYCHGQRLNRSARHVFVGGSTLPDVGSRAIGKAL